MTTEPVQHSRSAKKHNPEDQVYLKTPRIDGPIPEHIIQDNMEIPGWKLSLTQSFGNCELKIALAQSYGDCKLKLTLSLAETMSLVLRASIVTIFFQRVSLSEKTCLHFASLSTLHFARWGKHVVTSTLGCFASACSLHFASLEVHMKVCMQTLHWMFMAFLLESSWLPLPAPLSFSAFRSLAILAFCPLPPPMITISYN